MGCYFNPLGHEMVHNWPYIESCIPSTISSESGFDAACSESRNWFNDGIAIYFAVVLSYRLRIYRTS
jgi:predicted metalloprotease with PDZ domain